MNKQALLAKELSNFYAIHKQINNYFNGSEISFLSEKVQRAVVEYVKLSCRLEEEASAWLQQHDINPGNTVDSIVEEITTNLDEIVQQQIDNEIKALGYRMSINRLISYQMANAENLQLIAGNQEGFVSLTQAGAELQTIKDTVVA